jgi:hypothetical protein
MVKRGPRRHGIEAAKAGAADESADQALQQGRMAGEVEHGPPSGSTEKEERARARLQNINAAKIGQRRGLRALEGCTA